MSDDKVWKAVERDAAKIRALAEREALFPGHPATDARSLSMALVETGGKSHLA